MEKRTSRVRGAIVAGLKKHAIPITTVQPGSDFDDLMFLKQLVGDARIVALGEATYGARECFLIKHRLLEFLVKQMKFNVLAVEASWAGSNLINEYVHTGEGNPCQFLAGLQSWAWNTQEALDIISWMREYNQALGNTSSISFCGFDNYASSVAIDNVIAYLHGISPEAEKEVNTLYAPFQPYANDGERYDELPLQTKSQCRRNLQRAYQLLIEHRAIYEAASSTEKFACALQSARVVVQAENVFNSSDPGLNDLYMAENICWLLDQAGSEAKMVLWADNSHIGKRGESMGVYLQKHYGDMLVTFGSSFYKGSVNAIDRRRESESWGMLISQEVPPPTEGSYEYLLGEVGLPQLFLDLRDLAVDSAVAAWLAGPLHHSIGEAHDTSRGRCSSYRTQLLDEYDAAIHLQDATPSTLLRSEDQGKKRYITPGKARNLNFEAGWAGWFTTGTHPQDYERQIEQVDEGDVHIYFASKADESLHSSASAQRVDGGEGGGGGEEEEEEEPFGGFGQIIDAYEYRGKQVRMIAYMKSEEVKQWAALCMRVDGPKGEVLSFDNMHDRPIKGDSDWNHYEIVLPVPTNSLDIFFGPFLVGKGKFWLRGLQIDSVE